KRFLRGERGRAARCGNRGCAHDRLLRRRGASVTVRRVLVLLVQLGIGHDQLLTADLACDFAPPDKLLARPPFACRRRSTNVSFKLANVCASPSACSPRSSARATSRSKSTPPRPTSVRSSPTTPSRLF